MRGDALVRFPRRGCSLLSCAVLAYALCKDMCRRDTNPLSTESNLTFRISLSLADKRSVCLVDMCLFFYKIGGETEALYAEVEFAELGRTLVIEPSEFTDIDRADVFYL